MLPAEQRLALSYTSSELRPALATIFALDQRCARIVASATEPMLAQMRLAWWRDMLAKPVMERPNGDVVLDAIGQHWQGRESSLAALIDGWEHMLEAAPLPENAAMLFAAGRAEPIAKLAEDSASSGIAAIARKATISWALSDAASHTSDAVEREMLLALAQRTMGGQIRLPRHLRGVAVLNALARRSVQNGGRPLMEGRGAALVALRAGLLGR